MRSIIVGSVAAAIVLVAAGCASPGADAPTAPGSPASLADLPAPSPAGEVLAIATVLEQDDGAILCIGAVAESAPPQCGGPELLGWNWDAFEHQETGGVRWVQGVAITGVYEAAADAFTQTGEPMSAAAITLPAIEVPSGELDEATIASVQQELLALERPDVLGVNGYDGIVVLDVIYDDGSMQSALDAAYGPGTVFVASALRDAGGSAGDAPELVDPPMDTAAPVITGAEAQARLRALPTPSATEPVIATGIVLEAASGPLAGTPMLCYTVAASLPPQCGGPAVVGWEWSAIGHEEASGVRWTDSLAMRVTYDAASNAVTPVEMLDLAALSMPARETPTGSLDASTLQAVQDDLFALERADVLGGGGGTGIVELEVVFDDGSIQAALDGIYGPGAVHVWSWFR